MWPVQETSYCMASNFRGAKISCYFEYAILEFSWVLIFVGTVFRVFLYFKCYLRPFVNKMHQGLKLCCYHTVLTLFDKFISI